MGQPAGVVIPEKIFFKIGEVCDLVGVQAHVLRYWETEFPMLSPQKNRSGQRSYRRRDVEIALQIKELLYEDLYTIAGAKKKLQNEMREASRLKIVRNDENKKEEYIKEVKSSKTKDLDIEDEELEIGEIEDSAEDGALALDSEKQQALSTLTEQLLELRELLNKGKFEDRASAEKNY